MEDSFRQVAPIAQTAAQLFYARLFELDPDLELLFKRNPSEQGRKLMQMLGLAVNSLDRMDQLLPVVQSLGTRHVSYGVRDKDYDTVGQALLWTLRKGLGDAFTPDVETAWSMVYATPRICNAKWISSRNTRNGDGLRLEAVCLRGHREPCASELVG